MYTTFKLSAEDENICFNKYLETKNLQDLEPVFKSIYWLIAKAIKGGSISYYDKEDLIQECYVEIIRKIDKFDPTKGRLSSYTGNSLLLRGVLSNIYAASNRKKRGSLVEVAAVEINDFDKGVDLIECAEDPSSNVEDLILHNEIMDNIAQTMQTMGDVAKSHLEGFLLGMTPRELKCSPQQLYLDIDALKVRYHGYKGKPTVTEQQKDEIRALYATGNYSQRKLAALYGYKGCDSIIRILREKK